jgi:hypothetical protein
MSEKRSSEALPIVLRAEAAYVAHYSVVPFPVLFFNGCGHPDKFSFGTGRVGVSGNISIHIIVYPRCFIRPHFSHMYKLII